jgi:hypothetical protein
MSATVVPSIHCKPDSGKYPSRIDIATSRNLSAIRISIAQRRASASETILHNRLGTDAIMRITRCRTSAFMLMGIEIPSDFHGP